MFPPRTVTHHPPPSCGLPPFFCPSFIPRRRGLVFRQRGLAVHPALPSGAPNLAVLALAPALCPLRIPRCGRVNSLRGEWSVWGDEYTGSKKASRLVREDSVCEWQRKRIEQDRPRRRGRRAGSEKFGRIAFRQLAPCAPKRRTNACDPRKKRCRKARSVRKRIRRCAQPA